MNTVTTKDGTQILAAPVTALDLKNAVHVGHSTGGGEVARYIQGAPHGLCTTHKNVVNEELLAFVET
jgi:hypothetical protein